MLTNNLNSIFTRAVLLELLPPQHSDAFFEALYGDTNEGAYDISLAFKDYDPGKRTLAFEIQLHERPGKCLACNLTYGLPEVFTRHPLINVQGMVERIEALLGGDTKCTGWELDHTQTPSDKMHAIPLTIWLA